MTHQGKTKSRSAPEKPAALEQDRPRAGGKFVNPATSLKLLVFFAGAVLMGLEIAGSRVLAPYFGNSVFVWGSLISVFLVALSLGYYCGGLLADKYPSRVLLNCICALVSVMILCLALGAGQTCAALRDAGLEERAGPLVASMLLFLPPSIGMGMVSPFAVRLATQSVSMVGKVSGTLYALSTAGSIAGTLLTTFVLIPWFGLSTILNGLGVCLLVVSILTWPFGKSNQALAAMTLVGGLTLAFSLGAASPTARLGPYDELVVDVDTPYHRISVVDSAVVVDKRSLPSRSLRFDRFVESEILKAPPYPSVAGYTNYFHLAFLAKPEIKRVLFIGAGGGIGPRTFQMHNPDMEIDVVDVDPKVLELARTHFHLEEHPKIRLTAKDGRIYVRQSTATYDCIILDAFSAGGRIPFHLVTKEFLQLCADRLAPDGVFLMNINSALEGPRAQIFQSIYRTFDAVFPNTYVFAMDHQQRPTQFTMNVILLGTRDKTRLTRAQWATRAADYRSTSYVNPRMVRAMVDDLLVTLPDMSRAPLFTDDYAPIETMPF